jgi:dTDP-glucose 4,6-dehydratase
VTRQFQRAVVTGGAGFLGSRVCGRLLEQGTAVLCLDNFLTGSRSVAPPPDGPPFESRFCDVSEPFDVAGPVDLMLHMASPAAAADHARYPLRTLEAAGVGGQHRQPAGGDRQADRGAHRRPGRVGVADRPRAPAARRPDVPQA